MTSSVDLTTALLVGVIALIGWSLVNQLALRRQSIQTVTALLGLGGRGGLLQDVRELMIARQELEKSVVALNSAVAELQRFRRILENVAQLRKGDLGDSTARRRPGEGG